MKVEVRRYDGAFPRSTITYATDGVTKQLVDTWTVRIPLWVTLAGPFKQDGYRSAQTACLAADLFMRSGGGRNRVPPHERTGDWEWDNGIGTAKYAPVGGSS